MLKTNGNFHISYIKVYCLYRKVYARIFLMHIFIFGHHLNYITEYLSLSSVTISRVLSETFYVKLIFNSNCILIYYL